MLDPKTFIGRSPQQVEKSTGPNGEVSQALERYREFVEGGSDGRFACLGNLHKLGIVLTVNL